jgi:hypothetical protein
MKPYPTSVPLRLLSLCAAFLLLGSSVQAALDPSLPPGGNFDLTHWYLGLPDTGSSSIQPSALEAGYTSQYFYTGADGAMVFWAPVNGGTTSGSTYPRSELRELIAGVDNSTNINWTALGTHTLTAQCRVTQVPSIGKVIIGQIHGGSTPLCKIYYSSGTLYARCHTQPTGGTENQYEFGTTSLNAPINYELEVIDGVLRMTVNGVTHTFDFVTGTNWGGSSFYFKAGSYCQDNVGQSDEGSRVAFYSLAVNHVIDPPPAPTNLAATPGKKKITLSWSAAPGASSYNVKRSLTSGGPYTTVATNVTATTYANGGLTTGTRYYYVVSAVNTGGESPNSSQATAVSN